MAHITSHFDLCTYELVKKYAFGSMHMHSGYNPTKSLCTRGIVAPKKGQENLMNGG